MSTRGLTSHRGSGRQGTQRGSWRRSGTVATSSNTGTANESSGGSASRGKRPYRGHSKQATNAQARPTHFLSLPLGGHSALRSRIQAFKDELLLSDPPIAGLDQSIIVQPSRLHITLGVMALRDNLSVSDGNFNDSGVGATGTNPSESREDPPPKTVSEALAFLHGLKDRITEELKPDSSSSSDPGIVTVPLNTIGVFNTDKKQTAHVLWIGPKKSHDRTALDKVSNLVNEAFREHGFITEKRPLKLHCTILNTKYRKGSGRKGPIPFSTEAIFTSDAYRNLMNTPSGSPNTNQAVMPSQDTSIECGTWPIDEIQLCQMVGRDPVTGSYISVGSLKLS